MTTREDRLPYEVGGLLYTPALRTELADKIAAGAYPALTSVALCLEDSIQSDAVSLAEERLLETLAALREQQLPKLPLLFVRVRSPEHLARIHALLGDVSDMLCGYILPKFEPESAEAYTRRIAQINQGRKTPLYIMPILESHAVADIGRRTDNLLRLKAILDEAKPFVLNVRVGGNDFSQLYGVRRSVHQSIYDIAVIRDILADVLNVFSGDYVVSGPVWEYFGENVHEPWAEGLRAELALDRLNGFVGKTAIHPSQLPLIYESLQVSQTDYDDALSILNWTPKLLGVEPSHDHSRMNEASCHTRWAERTLLLGQIYGIREARHEPPFNGPTLREVIP